MAGPYAFGPESAYRDLGRAVLAGRVTAADQRRLPFGRRDPERYRHQIKAGLDRAFEAAEEQQVALESAQLVVLSDQHGGARDGADDFQRCERAYNAALAYYHTIGHRLFLLGDVEELWECTPEEVLGSYRETLALEAEFRRTARLERSYGNHDDLWSDARQVRKYFASLPGVRVREGLKLRVVRGDEPVGVLFFVHGHQGTLTSDRYGAFSRLVVGYVWRPLQRTLRIASTTRALDWELRGAHNRAMFEWARERPERPVLIAGHTHQPVFGTSRPEPKPGRSPAEIERELREREAAGAPPEALARLRAELEWARAEERRTGGRAPMPCFAAVLLQHRLLLVRRWRHHGDRDRGR